MLIKLMQHYIPGFIKKKKLNELFYMTADAFQSGQPQLRGLSYNECLFKYAVFTKEQAENYLLSGHAIEEIKNRLYKNSYIFGQNLRKSLRIATWEEAVTVLQIIYKLVRIDFQCDRHGEIIIRECFFSQYYSAGVCELISSLDEGLAAGLSGGKLYFDQRITEGGSCCKGYLKEGALK